jgi:glycosyltransferase involved in cell wall biosynthesis
VTALDSLRVLVIHEWLYTRAGSERTLEQILQVFPQADLHAGVVASEFRETDPLARRARESWVGRIPGARTHHRWFLPLHALAWAGMDASGYDLVISNSHAFEKCVRVRPGTTHLCYCYSPPRYIWDLQSVYQEHGTLAQRLALSTAAPVLRAIDRGAASRVDHFLSISKTVAGRVARHYGRESNVVYPPVQAKPQGDARGATGFLLYLGRLVGYKRVDLVIQAAERLGVKLIVAGDGPERSRLEQMAGSNTEFVGAVSESEAGALLSRCASFVFAGEEDFGIAPVEANAHGRPVVYFNRGGVTETMVPGRTGTPFNEPTVASLCESIERCLASSWDEPALRANAERFAPERFRAAFEENVARVLTVPGRSRRGATPAPSLR